jgi:uncharacterized membrane protein
MTLDERAFAASLNKHRVEALTDGIYAVAMTLLVLELKIPESARLDGEAAFVNQLLHLAPKFLAWIISFFILGIFWISHQRAFHYVRSVDAKLLWINLFTLLFASLLPFSSALIGEHPAFFWAQVFYAANMAALALAAIAQIAHVENHPELCHTPVPPHVARGARFRCWSLVAVAVLAVVLAAIDPRIGTLAFMLMIVLARVSRRRESREAHEAALLSSDRPFP